MAKVVTFRIDDSAGKRLLAALKTDSGPFDRMFKQWAALYSARMKRRFVAEGDGEWPPLAPSTIRGRRSGESNRRRKRGRRDPRSAKTTTRGGATSSTVRILRDVGLLLNALSIGAVGNLTRRIRHGVRFGFSGARREGAFTYRDLAEVHQVGIPGRLPAREILVDPKRYPGLVRQFMTAMRRAIERRW